MLQAVQACPDAVRVPASELSSAKAGKASVLAKSLRTKAVCADILAGLLRLWSAEGKGILLLDEVDQLLHPLKSELNFPIGPWSPLHLRYCP